MDIFYRLTQWYMPAELSPDELRKRNMLLLAQLVLLPVLTAFAVVKAGQSGVTLEVWLLVTGAVLSAVVLLALRYLRDLLPLFRLGALFITLFAWYEIFTGSGSGVAFLWFYFHPLMSFFLFGTKEGSWWITISSSGLLGIMLFDLGMYHYPPAVATRFSLSYILVCLLSYGLEAARHRYYTALHAEKLVLEQTLQQVQTLQRLMPICASCKKIRDDQGYWHQVESYIGHHAAIEFSHGLCPNCRAALFPHTTDQTLGEIAMNVEATSIVPTTPPPSAA